MEDPGLQAIFDHVVGRDVVRKLMQVSQEGRVSLTFLLYLETLNRSHHISKYINRVTYTSNVFGRIICIVQYTFYF